MSDAKGTNPQLSWQQAEFQGFTLTVEQKANKIAYQAGIPASFVYTVLRLEERVTALESKLNQQ